MFRWLMHVVVMLLVAALAANYFHNNGIGYGYAIHPYVYYGVGALVAFMPVFWAITHICGGLLLGIASGGILDGLRLGLLLGMGMALSKLWPAAFGLAIGAWLGDAGWSYVILSGMAGILLFALDRVLHYFWHATADVG